jgi:hypothetical protein
MGGFFLGLGMSDQVPVTHRMVADGEFEHAVEDQPPAAGPAPVEAEAELVQGALQVRVLARALVGAQQPAPGQRGDPVDPGQQPGVLPAGAGGPLIASDMAVAEPPSADADGRRTPALRFGDPRVMALAGGLCQALLAATGFTSKNLRVLIAGLLGSTYTPGQMTYDLRRLRLNGLIRRLPHTNRYTLTEDGIRIAVFYTKVYNRLLVPLTAANQAQAPPELRGALTAITHHVDDYANRARLPAPRET